MSQPLVLLVDDELPIVRVCTRILLQAGLVTTTANTIAEGMTQVHGQRFDLLICDVRLPDGNGMDVVREFVRCQEGRPAIVISGSPDDDSEAFAAALGVHDFIHKPFEVEHFLEAVKQALKMDGRGS